MNLKFKDFQKLNMGPKELDSIRALSFKKFEEQGFPTKRQEHWKYTDLKTIINNNFLNLQIFENKNSLQLNSSFLLKNFDHNKIILLNGSFIESNFSFEDEKKINIKSLKVALENKEEFEKIKKYFEDDQNSMISLNHALVNDGIICEIDNNYSFNKPLVLYNFFNKSADSKIVNNKVFISLGENSNLSLVDFYKS